jgi:hypothetical protein
VIARAGAVAEAAWDHDRLVSLRRVALPRRRCDAADPADWVQFDASAVGAVGLQSMPDATALRDARALLREAQREIEGHAALPAAAE